MRAVMLVAAAHAVWPRGRPADARCAAAGPPPARGGMAGVHVGREVSCGSCRRAARLAAAPWQERLRLRLRGGAPDADGASDEEDPDYAPAAASSGGSDDGAADGTPRDGAPAGSGASRSAAASASLQPGSSVLDESQFVEPSSAGDSTDELLGSGAHEGGPLAGDGGAGRAKMEDEDEDEEEEEEAGEDEDEEEAEGAFGDDEAVEEEVEESVPEQETGEAREARLLAQKLRNRTDVRRERFQDVLKRYERREKLKKIEAKHARQRFTRELEEFLGIQPPRAPRTLHERVCQDEGACAAPPAMPGNQTVANSIRLAFDDSDAIEVSKESGVTLPEAVQLVRSQQTIVVSLGSYRWAHALQVPLLSLSGERLVSIRGTPSAHVASLSGSSSVPLGPRLIGRWELLPSSIGNVTCATLFHNASSAAPGSANTTLPLLGTESHSGSGEREVGDERALGLDSGVGGGEGGIGEGEGGDGRAPMQVDGGSGQGLDEMGIGVDGPSGVGGGGGGGVKEGRLERGGHSLYRCIHT